MASVLTVNRGTTFAITSIYNKNGTPSTDGQSLLFTVKADESDLDDADASHLGGLLKNVTMSGATNVITINPVDTQDIPPGKYWYDLKVIETAGPIYRVDKGRFIISASPTNRLST